METELNSLSSSFGFFHSSAGSDISVSKSVFGRAQDLDSGADRSSSEPEPALIAASIGLTDPLLYIYTSGTTGLPKAVVIKHIR